MACHPGGLFQHGHVEVDCHPISPETRGWFLRNLSDIWNLQLASKPEETIAARDRRMA
jgi:hypothetical protein